MKVSDDSALSVDCNLNYNLKNCIINNKNQFPDPSTWQDYTPLSEF